MTTNSTWAALRNPAFRKLWIAAVISGTCVAAHDSAATWTMNIFTGSPLLLSLMSTVASLPFFLPSLVLRTEVANIYGKELPASRFSLMIEETMLQAVRHDAACVCVNLFQIPGAPEVHAQCAENILKLKPQADYYGMPMMVEPLVFRPNSEAGGYMVNGDETAITYLVRQAVELGADIVKADPTDEVSIYHKVVEVASGIPVLVRGGGRVSDQVILERTRGMLEQGAAGIVYGRNVIQHPNPKGITRALMAMVHDDASVEDALRLIALNPPA